MNRHIVVLAEERLTIQGLLNRAVMESPTSDRMGSFHVAKDESELLDTLRLGVSILLLSSTFSKKEHNDFIKQILAEYPTIRIISLHHRYADRTPLEHGAFYVIDKPVRNPVLWSKLEEAMNDIEEKEGIDTLYSEPAEEEVNEESKDSEKYEHTFHVKQDESVPNVSHPSSPVIIADDDDEDDFDPFASYPKPTTSPVVPSPVLVVEEEDEEIGVSGFLIKEDEVEIPNQLSSQEDVETVNEEDMPFDLIQDEDDGTNDGVNGETSSESFFVINESFDVEREQGRITEPFVEEPKPVEESVNEEQGVIPFELEDEEVFLAEEETTMEKDEFVVTDTEEEEASVDTEETYVSDDLMLSTEPIESVELDEMVEEDLEESEETHELQLATESNTTTLKPLEINGSRTLQPPKPDLEQEKDIFDKTMVYDEKSEWTKADEGFTAKNGQFVSLVPPRPKRTLQTGETQRGQTDKDVDSGGLFGSVRSLFKK
ncbi:hypothetical protein JMA_41740 (plasmid) [Jeotgalibacillus malaysiensis]|uniref:Uncharacterized protein n=1 Tax=Jeotgalibacillus malaysiensis TaxID=1508404 RepID=A0A0B5ATT3_9BACL|nr:hypothetical protein [Jeotgalibacillus malaysiensis]AJD93491.1 hypothetical protein JMA_41740 [Jeotgalibacillus malaysiensis]